MRGLDCDEGTMMDIRPREFYLFVSHYQDGTTVDLKPIFGHGAKPTSLESGVLRSVVSYIRPDVSDTKTHFTTPYQANIKDHQLILSF